MRNTLYYYNYHLMGYGGVWIFFTQLFSSSTDKYISYQSVIVFKPCFMGNVLVLLMCVLLALFFIFYDCDNEYLSIYIYINTMRQQVCN